MAVLDMRARGVSLNEYFKKKSFKKRYFQRRNDETGFITWAPRIWVNPYELCDDLVRWYSFKGIFQVV